jgi:propane monooxygenase large subunit
MHFWRFDGLDEKDFEWFESKYPGWYDEYGFFWEAYRELDSPKEQSLLLSGLLADAPPFCWTCTMPSVIDEDQCHRVVDGRTRFYCSKECRWIDESNPGRFTGDRNYFDRYHGMDIADVVTDLGFLRADGSTLTGQPHLRKEDKWTLDDLRAVGLGIESPNINRAKELGLPSGDHHAAFREGINVATGVNGGPGQVITKALDLPYPVG